MNYFYKGIFLKVLTFKENENPVEEATGVAGFAKEKDELAAVVETGPENENPVEAGVEAIRGGGFPREKLPVDDADSAAVTFGAPKVKLPVKRKCDKINAIIQANPIKSNFIIV